MTYSATNQIGRYVVVPLWVLDSGVSCKAVAVYARLASRADFDTGEAWPSMKLLAEEAGMSESVARRAVDELVQAGAVNVEPRHDPETGRQTSNLFTVMQVQANEPQPTDNNEREGVKNDPPLDSDRGEGLDSDRGEGVKNDRRTNTHKELEKEITIRACLNSEALEEISEPRRLCEHLAQRIVENGSKRPAITTAWLKDMDRLLRLDGRTPDQVERAIDWCQADAFWRANILSPRKLREKFETLRLQAKRKNDSTRTSGIAMVDELERHLRTAGVGGYDQPQPHQLNQRDENP